MKIKLQKLPPIILCLMIAVFLINSPNKAADCVSNSLKLCAHKLIPSLFPFFILSSLIRELGIAGTLSRSLQKPFRLLFGVSGSGALPLILGLTGGYPVGVKTICDMHAEGDISTNEAKRLLLFCGNTGPAFIIGFAGASLFSSTKIGAILYIIHILSAVLIGIFCHIILGKTDDSAYDKSDESQNFSKAFTKAVSDGLFSSLNVSSYVVLFAVFTGLSDVFGLISALCSISARIGFDPVRTQALFTGIAELGSGLDSLLPFVQNVSFSIPACAFLLGWGGISVHCQALSFISREGLPARFYVLSKLFHGILSALLASLYLSFGGVESVFAFWGHSTTKDFIFDYLGLFFSLFCALAALILHIARKRKHKKHASARPHISTSF